MQKIYKPLTDLKMGKMIFLLCWVAYFSTYIGRLNYSAAMAGMAADGFLTTLQLGYIGTAFFVMYGIGQLINGLAGDRVAPFKMLAAGLLVSSIMNLLMALCNGSFTMCLIWGLNGFAQSMIWSPIMRIFSQLLPESQRYKACIHINTTMAAGTFSAYGISALLLKYGSWKQVFLFAFLILLTVCIVWSFYFYKHRNLIQMEAVSPVQEAIQGGNAAPRTPDSLLKVFLTAGLVLILVPCIVHGMLKDGIANWFPTFLVKNFKLPADVSVVFTMLLPILNLTGTYLANAVNKLLKGNEVKTAKCLFAVSVLLFGAMLLCQKLLIPSVLLTAGATTLMVGVNTMLISILPLRFGSIGKASSITGILNSATYAGCSISMLLFGILSEKGGWGLLTLTWLILAVTAFVFCLLHLKRRK